MRNRANIALIGAGTAILFSCQSGFERIDRRVEQLLMENNQRLGSDATISVAQSEDRSAVRSGYSPQSTAEHPETVNPSASELSFNPLDEASDVLSRLDAYADIPDDALRLDLPTALSYASQHSREYRFAEEEYVLSALRLLIERHQWGPRFFNDVTATVSGDADGGLYDTSLDLVNEFSLTQRLPYGGSLSATALARATEDLHLRVAGEESQSAEIILAADIPILRGAGIVAREDRIQRERDLIYAARDFEDFRRAFYFDIVSDFLDLVVQQRSVINAERQVEQLKEVEARERQLYESGRSPRFQAALAEQATVTALDQLYVRQENYRLAVDRFKVRLNMPVEGAVLIVPSDFDLPIPDADINEAVQLAFAYRLDLQTQRDLVDDADRRLHNSRNDLLPNLDLAGNFTIPSDSAINSFEPEADEAHFEAGVTFGLPLDREIERLNVRQAEIDYEREQRNYSELRDLVAVSVRGSVRDIDRARYSLEIQERSIEIGEQRVASIEAAPDRATARDASDAANELLRALDSRDRAYRDLQVAIMRYLLETGQLRITPAGSLQAISGMDVN